MPPPYPTKNPTKQPHHLQEKAQELHHRPHPPNKHQPHLQPQQKQTKESQQKIKKLLQPKKESSKKANQLPKQKPRHQKKKKATVPAKRVQQFNYCSNIGTVIKLLKGIKFTKAQQTELQKTPFWPLINALSSTQLKASWCRCYNSIVAEMTTLYNKRKRSFVLGKKEMKLRSSDVKLIFGIDCGEDNITTKSYARPKDFELPFYKRRCKSIKRLDGKSLTKMFQQTKKGKSTNDRQDLTRVITLYLCLKLLMPTTGHILSWSFLNYVDNLNNIKKYNWVEAIKDTLMNSMANANNNPRHVTGCVMLLLKASQGL
ncbi:unnamed protein product [Camellia sinensis]